VRSLIGRFKDFLHYAVIGWTPLPQFFWLNEGLMCLLRGVTACCLSLVCVVALSVTGFLISFYSFQYGLTLYLFSGNPDSSLLSGSVLISLSLLFSDGPTKWILLRLEVLRSCKQLFWLKNIDFSSPESKQLVPLLC